MKKEKLDLPGDAEQLLKKELREKYKSRSSQVSRLGEKLREEDVTARALTSLALEWVDADDSNRAQGRPLGAKAQKEYAEESNRMILKINNDLLCHPDTARWGLEKRADYIKDQLIKQSRKQANGKPYKASTIKTKITGKG